MATDFNITMKQYNGVDYDTLYPKTTSDQIIDTIPLLTKTSGTLPVARGGTGGTTAAEARENIDAVSKAELKAETAARQSADSALQTELAKCGKFKIVTGSYTGNGTCGRSSKKELTFSAKPILLIVSGIEELMVAVRPASQSNTYAYLIWADNGISWYADGISQHMNTNNRFYSYIVFLETE